MAHNLTIDRMTGKAEMFYCGDAPWHGLGTKVDHALTGAEAIAAAGLGWWVERAPLYLQDGSEVPGWKATRRADTGDILGVVSDDYRVIQNLEAFTFLDALATEGAAMFHTAGSTHNSKRVWALVKLPESLVVVPGDRVDQYLMLYTGHDGTRGLTILFTPVRVVCDNTVRAALGSLYQNAAGSAPGNYYTIRHIGDVKHQLAEAQRVLGIGRKYFEAAGESFRAMSAREMSAAMLAGYLKAVVPDPEEAIVRGPGDAATHEQLYRAACDRGQRIRERIAFLFEAGRGNQLPGVRGTLWAAYNAATEWVDHVNVLRVDGEPKVRGFESAMFGAGEDVRQRAFDAAVTILRAA